MDLIDRQAAIDALIGDGPPELNYDFYYAEKIKALPSAQPEPSIPILWIEKQIDWLKSMDNEFSNITAMNISTLVKKWRKENGKDVGSD